MARRVYVGEESQQLGGLVLPPDDGTVKAGPKANWDFPMITTWSQRQKWSSLNPSFARRLMDLRTRLAALGWDLQIGSGWRPWSTQAGFLSTGATKTNFSYHNVTTDELRPNAFATDLRPQAGLSEDDLHRFHLDLREQAPLAGLNSGGWWDVPKEKRTRDAPLGWDPSHVEYPAESISTLRKRVAGFYRAHGIDPSAWENATKDGSGGGEEEGGGLGLLALGVVAASATALIYTRS